MWLGWITFIAFQEQRPLVVVNDIMFSLMKMLWLMTFYGSIHNGMFRLFHPKQFSRGQKKKLCKMLERSNRSYGLKYPAINNSYRKILLLVNSRQIEITKTCAVHKIASSLFYDYSSHEVSSRNPPWHFTHVKIVGTINNITHKK